MPLEDIPLGRQTQNRRGINLKFHLSTGLAAETGRGLRNVASPLRHPYHCGALLIFIFVYSLFPSQFLVPYAHVCPFP